MLESYKNRFPTMNVEATEQALVMMRRASLLVRELEQYFDARNMSLLRFLVLIVIERELTKRSLTVGEIARRVDVSKPVMTRAIRKLEKDKLIKISSTSNDKRIKHVALTKKGAAALTKVLPGYYELINRFMARPDEG